MKLRAPCWGLCSTRLLGRKRGHCNSQLASNAYQIRVYNDRISIWNAAHLSPEWTTELLARELSSRPHNPRIAYNFFRAGMIEVWGRGIRRIVDLCREAGNPTPAWRLASGGTSLWVRFPFSAAYLAADCTLRRYDVRDTTQKPTHGHGETTQKPARTTQKPAQERGETTQKSARTNQETARDQILDCLIAEPRLTRKALAERVGLTPDGVKYHLVKLKAAGVLRRVGSDRAGYWEVLL